MVQESLIFTMLLDVLLLQFKFEVEAIFDLN